VSDGIIVAIISGGFGVVIALIGLFAKANKRDHKENSSKLDYIAELLKDHLKGHP
jgi:biopolymer transport protein ExbB/TolQ